MCCLKVDEFAYQIRAEHGHRVGVVLRWYHRLAMNNSIHSHVATDYIT
jgi:hypothetical protein